MTTIRAAIALRYWIDLSIIIPVVMYGSDNSERIAPILQLIDAV